MVLSDRGGGFGLVRARQIFGAIALTSEFEMIGNHQSEARSADPIPGPVRWVIGSDHSIELARSAPACSCCSCCSCYSQVDHDRLDLSNPHSGLFWGFFEDHTRQSWQIHDRRSSAGRSPDLWIQDSRSERLLEADHVVRELFESCSRARPRQSWRSTWL